jgi:hypothetical protein
MRLDEMRVEVESYCAWIFSEIPVPESPLRKKASVTGHLPKTECVRAGRADLAGGARPPMASRATKRKVVTGFDYFDLLQTAIN